MKAPRTYTPSDSDLPEPSAIDLAAGIVSPMDIPVRTPVPLLRLKTRQFRKEKARLATLRSLMKHEGRKPYVCAAMRRLKRLQRRRSSCRLPITSFREKAQILCDSLDEDFHVMQNQSGVCRCLSCQHVRRWSSTLQPYRCTNRNCRITFASFTDLYEHQLDVHGGLDPRANRIVNELYHQQQGVLAFPPPTVYAGQQFLIPSRPPTPWKSMEELDEEARTLLKRLRERNQDLCVRPFNVFKIAYELVKRNGWKEMDRQYHIAMEHYFASMKFPVLSRGFHDGCPSVERGRNWLTSTDREDAQLLHPFSLGDKVDVEPEFVLIDTKRDRDICIELSDDEDEEDASVDSKCAGDWEGPVDVEVAVDDFEDANERKVSGADHDEDVNVMSYRYEGDEDIDVMDYEGDEDDEGDITERKGFSVDSEGEDNSVIIEDSGEDRDNLVKIEDSDRAKLSASARESESGSGDDETTSQVQLSSSEDSSKNDSDVASKIEKD